MDDVPGTGEVAGATRIARGDKGFGGGAEDAGGELGAGASAVVKREREAEGAELAAVVGEAELGEGREDDAGAGGYLGRGSHLAVHRRRGVGEGEARSGVHAGRRER